MSLPLTTEMLEASYEFLKTTPPFCNWNLPDAEDIRFFVNRKTKSKLAEYQWLGDRHSISMCAFGIGHTSTLMRTMAHEMVHLHLEQMGWESRGNENVHNLAFRKFASEICKIHGFDPKAFF